MRLTGTAVDRRFSIIKPVAKLLPVLAEAFGLGDARAAAAWLAGEGSRILGCRTEVGRWLGAMVARHGRVEHVLALHGEDYRTSVEDQRPFHETLFDRVLGEAEFTYIAQPTLYRMYADLARQNGVRYPLRNRGLYAQARVWARRNGADLAVRKVKWRKRDGRISTADVLCRSGDDRPELACNDARYGAPDDFGRWTWHVAV